MADYRYTATDASGKTVKGRMTAVSEEELYEKLKANQQYLTEVKEIAARGRLKKRPLKANQLSQFCRDIGTLLSAGVSLARALGILTNEDGLKPRAKQAYTDILKSIRQGNALSDAMEETGVFPPMMIYMFRAAETAGSLDKTALRLADHYEKEHRLNAKVSSSTIYPKFLAVMMVIVVAVLVGFVLPQFKDLFSLMDELPLPTRILYAITDLVKNYWYLLAAGAVLLVIVGQALGNIAPIRLWLDRNKVHMPLIGKLRQTIYTARFARTLSSLYSAGIPIVTSLQVARKTIGNTYIDKQFDALIPQVRAGGNLSDAIEQIDGFNRKFVSTVKVGEETGSLDTMLETTAASMEYDSEIAMNKMVSYLEPCMIVFMAILVGFIMLAVMMPIFQSYNAIETSAYQ